MVAKKEHTPSEWITDTVATCSVAGTKHKECTVCHTTLESGSIDKIAHTPATDAAVEATCSATGFTEGSHCSVCNAVIVAQEVVAKKDHTVVVDAAVEATCNSTGLTEGNHCSVCNATLVAQKATSKLMHVLSVKITDIPETCTEDGTYYVECTLCHIILERGSLEGGHNYESTVVPPTASAQGYTQHVCTRCNDTYNDTFVPARGFTGLAYVVNDDGKTCTITGLGIVTDTEITIPVQIDGYKVTAIGEKAFAECSELTKISLQDSIVSIGTRAFYKCAKLTEITIPTSVISIGTQIFYGCDSLTTVYYNGQYGNAENPFLSSKNLETVVFGGANIPAYVAYDVKTLKTVIILDSVKSIGSYSFQNCSNLTNITIGNSVAKINSYAFDGCISLTNITIPNSATNIGPYAFASCISLTNITIPDKVTSIGSHAFAWCRGLTSVTIGNGVTSIGNGTFYFCNSLTEITISNSVKSIGSFAFDFCSSLADVYITDVEAWMNIAFDGDEDAHPNYYGKLHILDDKGNEITELVIPDSITKINSFTFYNCSVLTSVTIPDSVTYIGSYAFKSCCSLMSVTIGNSVTSIGDKAFFECYKLVEVYNLSTSIALTKRSSNNGYAGYYALDIYTAIDEPSKLWIDDNGYIFYEDGDICYLIGYTGSETKLILPTSCNGKNYSLYKYLFYSCGYLTDIAIPNCVTSIGNYTFYNCSTLTSITIPDSVTTIGDYAFSRCSNLTSIIIPDSVTTIGDAAFSWCSNLTSIIIPDSVTDLGYETFMGCQQLTNVTIGNGVTSIGYSSFAYCYNLTNVTLPNSVWSIGGEAFLSCDLTSITIPASVWIIYDKAFYQCYLTSIIFEGTMDQWYGIEFGADWKDDFSTIEVICSDGTILLY